MSAKRCRGEEMVGVLTPRVFLLEVESCHKKSVANNNRNKVECDSTGACVHLQSS